jgi:hypothetical protein
MKTLLFFLLCLGPLIPVTAQDLIVKMNDEEIIAKVQEIKRSKVAYYLYADQDGEPLLLPKSEVYMIIYEDGMRQFFSDPRDPRDLLADTTNLEGKTLEELYAMGMEDASLYADKKALMWATMGTTIVMPLFGVFAGGAMVGIVALSPTNVNMSDIPDPELYRNPHYAEGFQEQTRKNRLKRASTGFGIGLGLQALFFLIVFAAG